MLLDSHLVPWALRNPHLEHTGEFDPQAWWDPVYRFYQASCLSLSSFLPPWTRRRKWCLVYCQNELRKVDLLPNWLSTQRTIDRVDSVPGGKTLSKHVSNWACSEKHYIMPLESTNQKAQSSHVMAYAIPTGHTPEHLGCGIRLSPAMAKLFEEAAGNWTFCKVNSGQTGTAHAHLLHGTRFYGFLCPERPIQKCLFNQD